MIVFAPNWIFVVLLAGIASVSMWWMYRNGHPHLSKPFVWLLPLLRGAAVFIAVMTLAEPMLQRDLHQQLLSHLRFVIDDSASMLTTDEDLPIDQKVEVALAHRWIQQNVASIDEIRRLSKLRESLKASTRSSASLTQAREATRQLADAGLAELSPEAEALLREDWVPSVARRRQVQIHEFVNRLSARERQLRKEFSESYQGEIPELDRMNRLKRAEHLIEATEKLKGEHEVSIESLGQRSSITDLTAIRPLRAAAGAETIILLSDGRHHADGTAPGDAAALSADAGTQLFTVGLGATAPRTDLILMNTYQSRRVAPGDLISGALEIYDSMPAGIPIRLSISDQDQGKELWTDEVMTTGAGARVFSFAFRVSGDITPQLPSLLRLSATVGSVEGEVRDDNNTMPMPVFLSAPSQSRIFVVDGRPRWDSRYLRNIFRRDPTWHVDSNFAPHQEALPDEETLKSYDLIIMGEVPAELVSDQHLDWLEQHVRSGGGLILIDGPREELRGLLAGHALSPVSWIDAPQWLESPHLALTREGSLQPALTLAPNKADNEAIWSYLPSPHRAIRTRPKSGATILAEARSETGNAPLLITQRVGEGRVLYISSDESWRWRYQKGDQYHTRYWQQLTRWVMAEPFLIQTDDVQFDLDSLRIRRGEVATVRGRTTEGRKFEAIVSRDDSEVLRTGELIEGLQPGDYTVSPAGFPDVSIPLTVIEATSIEETVTHAAPHILQEMAQRGGGEYFSEQQFPELLGILKSKRAIVTTIDSTSLWQSYGWFLLIVLLVAIELSLRKRAGLL